jgi:hypothetical protein
MMTGEYRTSCHQLANNCCLRSCGCSWYYRSMSLLTIPCECRRTTEGYVVNWLEGCTGIVPSVARVDPSNGQSEFCLYSGG